MAESPPLIPDAGSTALVLIDMQGFIVNAPLVPLSGREVLANTVRLADAARAAGILVVIVQAGGGAISLKPPSDAGMPPLSFQPNSHRVDEALGPREGDIVITKYNWGAFYGTDLDIQLRRRGINTIILGGLVTNFGVEGTARQAHERGYHQVIVSDAMSSFTLQEHEYPLAVPLARVGRVRTTDQVLAAIAQG